MRRSHSLVDGYQLSKVTHENSGADRNSHYSVHYNCIYPVCANGKNLYLLRFTGSPVLEVCRILYRDSRLATRDSRQGAVSKRTTKFYGDLVIMIKRILATSLLYIIIYGSKRTDRFL